LGSQGEVETISGTVEDARDELQRAQEWLARLEAFVFKLEPFEKMLRDQGIELPPPSFRHEKKQKAK
jgi:hypothetical protein